MMGYFDANRGMAVCPSTKSPEHMARLKLPYACKLLFQVPLPMHHSHNATDHVQSKSSRLDQLPCSSRDHICLLFAMAAM
jgi:hypothetical protein